MKIEASTVYVHTKSKRNYCVLYVAKLQIDDPSYDMTEVVVYESVDDGLIWVRPLTEFVTRFEELT